MIIKGKYTSEWFGECTITTNATLNTDTNQLDIEMSDVEIDDNSILFDEYFISDDGEIYDNICPHCHECLTKTYMDEGVGKQLFEVTECPNCGIM